MRPEIRQRCTSRRVSDTQQQQSSSRGTGDDNPIPSQYAFPQRSGHHGGLRSRVLASRSVRGPLVCFYRPVGGVPRCDLTAPIENGGAKLPGVPVSSFVYFPTLCLDKIQECAIQEISSFDPPLDPILLASFTTHHDISGWLERLLIP